MASSSSSTSIYSLIEGFWDICSRILSLPDELFLGCSVVMVDWVMFVMNMIMFVSTVVRVVSLIHMKIFLK
jgi:hypothetical protein